MEPLQRVLDEIQKYEHPFFDFSATEKDDGKEIVEVSFSVGQTKYEAEFTPEGKTLAIDKGVAQKDLPEKVSKAIDSKYPGAKLTAIEEVTKDDKVAYHEIDLKTKAGDAVEIQVDPDGKIINEEKKGKEEKEGKESKDEKEEKK